MFKKCIIAAAATATLAACAGQHQIVWDKPDGSIRGFNQDKLECMQTAINTVGGYAAFGNLWMVAIAANNNRHAQQEVFSTCMQARGYTPRDANAQAPPPPAPPVAVTQPVASARSQPVAQPVTATLRAGPVSVATSPQPVAPAALSPLPPAPASTSATPPAGPDVLSNPTAVSSGEYDYEAARRQYEQAQQLYQSKLQGGAGGKLPQ